ncbi:MAG: sigma-70 family RNA polymerase sigma factor [Isosphaeraceae bacterium]
MSNSTYRKVDRMPAGQHSFAQDIQTLFESGSLGELTDRQLLERFTTREAESAELAFAVLLKRHGPMVLRTCMAILHDRHEAEDATQATFLLLASKAASLWVRDSLGPWLFGVARRVASCARSTAFRRRAHEQAAAKAPAWITEDPGRDEIDAILHEEVNRLPQGYRAAVVLCDLEGLTQEQAALQLGWPAGTVRSRLARGRGRLRDRLTRRGLAPAAVGAGGSATRQTNAFLLPATLAEATIRAAMPLSLGQPAASATASAITLMEGVMKVMFWSKFKLITASALFGAVLLTGSAVIGRRAMGFPRPQTDAAKPQSKSTVGQGGAPVAPAAAPSAPTKLTANQQARLDLARKIRDGMLKRYIAGEIDLIAYLRWQKRYDDIAGEMARGDAERRRHYESQVATMKQIEDRSRELYRNGMITETDLLVAELERLEAEAALEKFKATVKNEPVPDNKTRR